MNEENQIFIIVNIYFKSQGKYKGEPLKARNFLHILKVLLKNLG